MLMRWAWFIQMRVGAYRHKGRSLRVNLVGAVYANEGAGPDRGQLVQSVPVLLISIYL